jgi:DNA repair photolyase
MLRLPREVSELWQEWLAAHYPGRAAKVMARLRDMQGGRDYDPRSGQRRRGQGVYADTIGRRFKIACKRLGLQEHTTRLGSDLFVRPPQAGDQMTLF